MVRRLLYRRDASGQSCYMFEFEEPLFLNQFASLAALNLIWWDDLRKHFSVFPFEGLSDDELWGEHTSSGFRVDVPSDDFKAYMLGQRQLYCTLVHCLWIIGDEHALYWVSRDGDTTALDVMTTLCGELPAMELNNYLPLLK